MKIPLLALAFWLFELGTAWAQGEVRLTPANVGSFGAPSGSLLSAEGGNGGTTFLTVAQAASNLNYWTLNGGSVSRLTGNVGIGNGSPTVPLHIGSGANSSDNAAVSIARTAKNLSNGHGYADCTTVDSLPGGYASFDARVNITGNDSTDHVALFQSALTLSSDFSGVVPDGYGLFSSLRQLGGTMRNWHGAYIPNPSKTGGTLVTNYGLYIEAQNAGSTNYSIASGGNARSFFGGDVFLTSGARLGLSTSDILFSPTEKIHIKSAFNTDCGIRLEQSGRIDWILKSPGASNDFVIFDSFGEKFRIVQNTGSIRSASLAGSGSAIPYVSSTGDMSRSGLLWDETTRRLAVSATAFTPDQDFEIRKNNDVTFRMYRNGINYWTQTANLDWTLGDVAGTKIWVTNAGSGRFGIGNSPTVRLDVAAGGVRFRDFTTAGNIISNDASGNLSSIAPSSLLFSSLAGTGTRMVTASATGGLSFVDLSASTSSTLITLAAQGTRNLRLGAGGSTTTVATGADRNLTVRDDGSISLYTGLTADPSTPFPASIYYRSDLGRFMLRNGVSTATAAQVETDIVGTANAIIATTHTPGGSERFVRYDANANAQTVTLGGSLDEGFEYNFVCTRNGTNAIAFAAESGYSFIVEGVASLFVSSYTAAAYEHIEAHRRGTVIYIDK